MDELVGVVYIFGAMLILCFITGMFYGLVNNFSPLKIPNRAFMFNLKLAIAVFIILRFIFFANGKQFQGIVEIKGFIWLVFFLGVSSLFGMSIGMIIKSLLKKLSSSDSR